MLQKFISKLNKLNNYYVLSAQEETFIVSTRIKFKEIRSLSLNVFQPLTKEVEKEVAIFFLLNIEDKSLELAKQFIPRKLPVLNLTGKQLNLKADDLERLLNKFIKEYYALQ